MSNNDPLLLAIDQGTTSSRAIAYTAAGEPVGVAQREFTQIFPADGWVEHDPEEIWQTTLAVCREVVDAAGGPGRFAAIGITNQRETTVVWDRDTGKAVHNAIVWQDRRTADHCAELREQGHEQNVSEKTGLLLDPYFSATKIGWILDHVDGARERVSSLAAGTIDAFLIWRLTGGAVHATDVTNASRTMLYDIDAGRWDDELLDLFRVPASLLPEVRDNTADYGKTVPEIFGGEIPVLGVAGDQQAAAIGQACIQPGMIKSTYGTGCFAILNTGERIVRSRHRLLTTIAYRVNGSTRYALEGAIFVAGAAVQWLRDGLGIIESAPQTEAMARSLPGNNGVYLVPAFTGLGAPHWDPHARGALYGLTRDTGPAELARAALEAVGYSTRELLDAMANDGQPSSSVRVDGGMIANDWLAQFLTDITGVVVERPVVTETTALGAAMLAGVQAGLFSSLEEAGKCWQLDKRFEPAMEDEERERLLNGWHDAVRRTLT